MSRITVPAGYQGGEKAYLATLAPELGKGLNGLSKAVYTHSQLPLRVFDWVARHIFGVYNTMDDFKGH